MIALITAALKAFAAIPQIIVELQKLGANIADMIETQKTANKLKALHLDLLEAQRSGKPGPVNEQWRRIAG